MTPNLPTLPAGWELKKLGDVVTEISSKIQAQQCQDLPYLSLENIESQTGKLLNVSTAKESNVIGTCSKFTKDTVIYSKLRPYLNKVAIPDFDGVGTTELIVFQPKDNLDKIFLANFLRSESVVNIINASSYGAKMPRTSSKFLKELEIPLPPLDEQKRLVSLLDTLFVKIDRSIELLDENIAAADALLPSALNTVFGELEEKWKTKTIEDVLQIIDGDRGNNYPKKDDFFEEEYCLFLSAKNVTKNGFIFKDNQFITKEKDALLRKGRLEKNDLVLTTRGTIGNVAIFDDSVPYKIMRLNSGMVILRIFNEIILHRFLYVFLNSPSFENFLNEIQSGSAQPQISIKNLKSLKIPIPPLDIQIQTVAYLDSVRERALRLKAAQNTKKSRLIALKASILDRAFKGEL